MVRYQHAEGGERRGPDDGEGAPVWFAAHQDRIPDVLAQLVQGDRAQLDLTAAADRPPAGSRRLDEATVALQAEHGNRPAIDHQLAESEAGPARYLRLLPDQVVHHARGEVPPAALGLDQDVPVPAVPGRMSDQAGQAGPEDDRGSDGRH